MTTTFFLNPARCCPYSFVIRSDIYMVISRIWVH